ncbi:MAG: calcium/sodium antiporter [Bacteroides sp.]|nr:calcium/sodium antiporter [Roseburia sp.]MCM1346735.1 calcium/sodium antiporter [Bacteroides sp.]MCM1420175.1 calcium/sodium antiporter [Bacteroides sp.]
MTDILLSILLFAGGLVAILKGADWLTDGASAVAKRLNVSTLVIGLTIVAFGTSAPELVISLLSAISGRTEMALGNVIGSNIFNVFAIMGMTALVAPIKVSKNNLRYDIPLCILASVVLFVMANDSFFNETPTNSINRTEGITLLAFFLIFMAYTFAIAKKGHKNADYHQENATSPKGNTRNKEELPSVAVDEMPIWKSCLFIIVGLTGLILGGNWFVDGASEIAAALGVSQSVIALTIVGAGTSAPELVTSIVAARKGDTDMAMGNIVGSNVFNIFLILGISSTVCPLSLGNITMFDFLVLLISSTALWFCCKTGKTYHTVTRTEGTLLTLCMIGYYIYIINFMN